MAVMITPAVISKMLAMLSQGVMASQPRGAQSGQYAFAQQVGQSADALAEQEYRKKLAEEEKKRNSPVKSLVRTAAQVAGDVAGTLIPVPVVGQAIGRAGGEALGQALTGEKVDVGGDLTRGLAAGVTGEGIGKLGDMAGQAGLSDTAQAYAGGEPTDAVAAAAQPAMSFGDKALTRVGQSLQPGGAANKSLTQMASQIANPPAQAAPLPGANITMPFISQQALQAPQQEVLAARATAAAGQQQQFQNSLTSQAAELAQKQFGLTAEEHQQMQQYRQSQLALEQNRQQPVNLGDRVEMVPLEAAPGAAPQSLKTGVSPDTTARTEAEVTAAGMRGAAGSKQPGMKEFTAYAQARLGKPPNPTIDGPEAVAEYQKNFDETAKNWQLAFGGGDSQTAPVAPRPATPAPANVAPQGGAPLAAGQAPHVQAAPLAPVHPTPVTAAATQAANPLATNPAASTQVVPVPGTHVSRVMPVTGAAQQVAAPPTAPVPVATPAPYVASNAPTIDQSDSAMLNTEAADPGVAGHIRQLFNMDPPEAIAQAHTLMAQGKTLPEVQALYGPNHPIVQAFSRLMPALTVGVR